MINCVKVNTLKKKKKHIKNKIKNTLISYNFNYFFILIFKYMFIQLAKRYNITFFQNDQT